MRIGDYEISAPVVDHLSLDGGAMFGSVPKVLWERVITPDEKNRIPLACRLLLLKSSERTFLVDVGCGDKWSEKEKGIFAFESQLDAPLSEVLSGVTDVIITHLHFDHAGGISVRGEDGELRLSFPDARVYVSKKNYEHAKSPGVREKASYLSDNISVLETADLRLTEDGEEIVPGLSVHQANGHTHGLQWPKLTGDQGTIVFPSDLMPTAHHVPVAWVMGYDLSAETAMAEKQEFLARAEQETWMVVFEHDRQTAAGTIGRDERGRYKLKSAISL